jgi:hypothetical protein
MAEWLKTGAMPEAFAAIRALSIGFDAVPGGKYPMLARATQW